MQNNMNSFLQQVMAWKKEGKTPQQVMGMLIQQNPQLMQTANQLRNMANGRNPKEFVIQLARQNGATEENMEFMKQFFN